MTTLTTPHTPERITEHCNKTYPYVYANNMFDRFIELTFSLEILPGGVPPRFSPPVEDSHLISIEPPPNNVDSPYSYTFDLLDTDPTSDDNTTFENITAIFSTYASRTLRDRITRLADPALTLIQTTDLIDAHDAHRELYRTVHTELDTLPLKVKSIDSDTVENIRDATQTRKENIENTPPHITTITCPLCATTTTHINRSPSAPNRIERLYCPDCNWSTPETLPDSHIHQHTNPLE